MSVMNVVSEGPDAQGGKAMMRPNEATGDRDLEPSTVRVAQTAGPGRYTFRLTQAPEDIAAAQALRHRAFRARAGGDARRGLDRDRFDALMTHALIERCADRTLAGCFRLMPFASGRDIVRSYSARSYDLAALMRFPGAMLEMGRFCIRAELRDPDILRVAWSALAAYVERHRIGLVFGCTSFQGISVARHAAAFAQLAARHLGPDRWRPAVKAARVVRLCAAPGPFPPDPLAAARAMPPLLRGYLAMGGWVSDHAVIDADLDTMHVFTALETRKVPAARRRFLLAPA